MVNWIPIVAATLAAVPAAATFFLAYGRYDGAFQDRVVFLYFIGGMALGALLGFATLILATGSAIIATVGLMLLIPISVVATINRRKWQGERHAVFNGGAAGLGASVMVAFSYLYYRANAPYQAALQPLTQAWEEGGKVGRAPSLDTVPFAFDPAFLGQGILFAAGIAGLLFGMGLLAGNGVRLRKQFRMAFLGTAILFAPIIFLEEFVRSPAWIWVLLLAAYGAIFGIAAERRILIEGIEEEARKQRRRLRRKASS